MEPTPLDADALMYYAATIACLAIALAELREAATPTAPDPGGHHLDESTVAALDAGHTVTLHRHQAPDLELTARPADDGGE